jgi:undecaprenyl-diphosphatase
MAFRQILDICLSTLRLRHSLQTVRKIERSIVPRLSLAHAVVFLTICACSTIAWSGGLDHRLSYDNSGIWKRNNQFAVVYGVIATETVGALWEGGDSRLGKTFWQSIDATTMGAVSSEGLKRAFSRERPSSTADPNRWFQGGSNHSFPSGEVTSVAAAVTPFVFEYGREYPAVYALELLPLYDGLARMKVRAHWQTDVLAGFALGTGAGYLSHSLEHPFILGVLPHGFTVGIKANF